MSDAGFADIYARFYDAVRRTLGCLGVPPAALDDAVQEVFVVVHRRVGEHGEVAREWIYGVTRRVAWRHHRTHDRSERRRQLADEPEDRGSPERRYAEKEAVAFMNAFLDTLDDDQRTVFVLAEIEELTAREVAAIVGASSNTVSSRLRLARGKLAAALARRSQEEPRRG
ncbi:MAG TPA: sigma-70 family RNA polymerase sigma factor, partial [Nannocystaceae bacterium]|nr:sigma-70 family RNA polymerase sigma factor [Nannocystaceae bacterium]